MYLRKISVKNYGPIESLSYSFRFDENGNTVPLIIIGKMDAVKHCCFQV